MLAILLDRVVMYIGCGDGYGFGGLDWVRWREGGREGGREGRGLWGFIINQKRVFFGEEKHIFRWLILLWMASQSELIMLIYVYRSLRLGALSD